VRGARTARENARLPRTILALKRGLAAAAVLLVAVPAAAPARTPPMPSDQTEVVVTLAAPSLAEARIPRPFAFGGSRLSLTAPASVAYVRALERAQRTVAARIVRAVPAATVRWRYSVVLDGMAVTVPRSELARVQHVPGVARVWPSYTYRPSLDRTPKLIGATQLWGSDLQTAGNGMKIGIIDQGIDQSHPFFDPAGFAYPPGFPKGNAAYTTAKVIVARVFSRPGATGALETLPFVGDGDVDDHGTHVAGIAAGDANTNADGVRVSGIAPRAYLGNYKALSIPTPGVGLNGNSPELVAAVEAAVKDGMDVINLSAGEIEVPPSRDVVAKAFNAAADAGVVVVASAGNDYSDFGSGSISSPATAAKAIAVAAATGGHGAPQPDHIAGFSSAGPTEYSLRLKPDVTAPGGLVLSSVPAAEGLWDEESGTSMAAPHVAGGVALLRQRHPSWTVAELKSALELTGVPVRSGTKEVPVTREGGGRIALVAADAPLLFTAPTAVSFGFRRPGSRAARVVALKDAGGGAGSWSVRFAVQRHPQGATLTVGRTVTVPGRLRLVAHAARTAPQGDVSGFVVLRRGSASRRIPVWFRVVRPRLALDRAIPLRRAGAYVGTTVGAPSRVAAYRYPDLSPTSVGFPARLAGPEVVYRLRLPRPAANFGVVVTRAAPGVSVQPRITLGADENRLAGYGALPIDLNPYRGDYGSARPVVGVTPAAAGTYEIVFDSLRRSRRGSFAFRVWIGDRTPPSIRLLSARAGTIRVAVTDAGAGIDRRSLAATIDGRARSVTYARGVARIAGVAAGSHTVTFRASDYQETKNTENVGPALPNTRTLKRAVVVR